MLKKISNIVNTRECYNFLNKTVPVLLKEKNNLFLHNKKRLEFHEPSMKTFEGKFSCGATSYLLHYYLRKNNINTKLGLKKKGYGKYLEDHSFLYLDDLIIDPTFRQFYNPNIRGDSYYYDFLYELPFVFVGNIFDFEDIENELNKIYFEEISINSLINDKMYFYRDFKDISHKLDCHHVVSNQDYSISKGEMFYNLHRFINYRLKIESL